MDVNCKFNLTHPPLLPGLQIAICVPLFDASSQLCRRERAAGVALARGRSERSLAPRCCRCALPLSRKHEAQRHEGRRLQALWPDGASGRKETRQQSKDRLLS